MSNPLKNIPLKTFRQFLTHQGLKCIRQSGGHEIWSRHDLTRPVPLQSHIDPVPEFIVKTILKTIKATKEDYIDFLRNG